MRIIFYILQKEFLQVLRNRYMIPIIFVMPFVQLLILVHAATFEMKNIDLGIVDQDVSMTSRQLKSKFTGSPFFKVRDFQQTYKTALAELTQGKLDVILRIPTRMERELNRENRAEIQIIANAINQNAASLSYAYISAILQDFNQKLIRDFRRAHGKTIPRAQTINTTVSYWYNPLLNYTTYMVPGILVILITVIGMFLSGMNVVREKEIGTIEQINVTPIRKHQFIIGKLMPFWIIALFELAFGLILGKLLFQIPLVGSIPLIFGMAAIYLLVVLGFGLFISTITHTQQQAMFIAFFFMIVFILMSGLFTPVESMPSWARVINHINPIYYFIRVMRMVLLKGSQFVDIRKEFFALLIYSIVTITMSTWRYRKTM